MEIGKTYVHRNTLDIAATVLKLEHHEGYELVNLRIFNRHNHIWYEDEWFEIKTNDLGNWKEMS